MEKKYKIIDNADSLYIINNGLTKKINDIDYEEWRLIGFLAENQWKEIIIKDINEKQAKICVYEGKKCFWVELYYLEEITSENEENEAKNKEIEDEETEQEIEIVETEKNNLSKINIFYQKIKPYFWIITIIIVIWLCVFKFFYDQKQAEIKKAKEKIELQTEQTKMADDISNLILEKAKEFDYQKEMRNKKRELENSYDEKINNSINRVKNLDLKIAEIEKQQIEKAQ